MIFSGIYFRIENLYRKIKRIEIEKAENLQYLTKVFLLEATCDETGMLDIPYGEGRSMMGGAVYK